MDRGGWKEGYQVKRVSRVSQMATVITLWRVSGYTAYMIEQILENVRDRFISNDNDPVVETVAAYFLRCCRVIFNIVEAHLLGFLSSILSSSKATFHIILKQQYDKMVESISSAPLPDITLSLSDQPSTSFPPCTVPSSSSSGRSHSS